VKNAKDVKKTFCTVYVPYITSRTDCQQHELNAKPRAQVRLATEKIELDLALYLTGNQVKHS
jgi:hypothetical protein